MSIDLVRVCPLHGRIEDTVTFCGKDYCPECLEAMFADHGVREVKLTRIDTERIANGPKVECECCGGERPDTQDACPICGHQSKRDPQNP